MHAAALMIAGRTAYRLRVMNTHEMAVTGIAMMLCFQNPAATIKSSDGVGDLPAR
jgi:hypothetical protein